MHIPALSTDIIIIGATGLVVLYGFVAGYGALVREAISVYVGLVLASSFGQPLYDFIQQQSGDNAAVSQTIVQLALFAIPIIILQFVRHRPHTHHQDSYIITFILAILTGLLFVSSVLTQLDQVTLSHIIDDSSLAGWIYDLRLVWIGAVPVAIAAGAIIKPHHKH
jgi:hypothetical protein